ncbi:MAG: cytidine deaminase [Bacteriovoracaceae bacterium]|nr:cytidine deaminase [Bacteriovoracaceae bacterium]
MEKQIESAYKVALKAREKAYAPYSHFKVGAALKIVGHDEIIPGCNVENASFGATVCAERTALLASVANHGKCEMEYIVVVTDTEPATQPCALCLQVMGEFSKPDTPVYLANLKGVQSKLSFKELLPNPFTEFEPNE